MSDEKTGQPDPTEDTEGHGIQTGSGDKQMYAKDTYAKDTFASQQGYAKDTYAKDTFAQSETDDDTEGHSVTDGPKGDQFADEKFADEKFADEKFADEK